MLDLSHIPNSQQDIQIFNANGSAWQTWRKPKKCSYVWIMCIGGAGGGGGGTGLTFDTIGGMGGGGGAISRAIWNANYLPDILYVQVGLGGSGGAGATTSGGVGTSGSAGTRSWVSFQPVSTPLAQNNLTGSGATSGAAGGTSTLSGATTAGEPALTTASASFLSSAIFIATAGQSSPNPATTSDVTPFTSQITTAGAGTNGSILATNITPLIKTGSDGITAGPGSNGIMSWKPFYSLGGASGGSLVNSNGGRGGDGAIGSGGGGGGSANCGSGFVAGSGGRGGDGLVVIISF